MPLRRSGFSPDYAATTTGICTRDRSTGSHDPASTQSLRPTTTNDMTQSKVSVLGFSPVHFRGLQPRQVSCYALFEGWLLLSLPPCCLRSKTPFCLTLSQNLGTLTLVWVVPLLVMRLTPHKPVSRTSTALTHSEFKKQSGSFRILVFSSVLYNVSNIRQRLD